MPTPTITTPIPDFPALTETEADFITQADTFYNAQKVFSGELAIAVPWIDQALTDIADDASNASDDAEAALADADRAEAAATQASLSAAASAGEGLDVSDSNVGAALVVVPTDGIGGKEAKIANVIRGQVVDVVGTTPSLNLNAGQVFKITLTGNTTVTFDTTGFIDLDGNAITFYLVIEQGGVAYSLTLPASVKADGDTPLETPGANQRAIYGLTTFDEGVTYIIARIATVAA